MDHNHPIKLSPPSKFIWRIENFPSLNNKTSHCFRWFTVGKSRWCIMIYPQVKDRTHLFVYLKPDIIGNQLAYAEFSVALLNQKNHAHTVCAAAKSLIGSTGYGWASYYRLADLHNPVKGFIVNDTCVIQVEISACTISTSQAK
ncbi:hypothetical protein MKX01_022224 [Papaver californicum]|nr:hypothetical protein MKX01_022224 [Papaver californicum]